MNESCATVALGTNLGDRRTNLELALAHIDQIDGASLAATSSLYESAPWGETDQPAFLNAIAVVTIQDGSPEDFLAALLAVEVRMGRRRERRWGPRLIDLDLITFGNQTRETAELRLPHPFVADRPFVYLPLREAAPDVALQFAPSADALAIESQTVRLSIAEPSVWGKQSDPTAVAATETNGEEETAALGHALAPFLLPGQTVGLDGPLGAGKSVLARSIARGLGITGPVPSPTYTICRDYRTPAGRFEHWDFYRLGSEEDLESTGFHDRTSREALRVVEWAEMFPGVLPAGSLRVRIEPIDAERRRLTFSASPYSLPFAVRSIVQSMAARLA